MALNVTFHPCSPELIRHFVFDVLAEPRLATERAHDATSDPVKRQFVEDAIYGPFVGWAEQLEARTLDVGRTLAFAAAAISGYLHFYSYARGSTLTSLVEQDARLSGVFTPLARLPSAPPALSWSGGDHQLLDGPCSASAYLAPETFDGLRAAIAALTRDSAETFSLFDALDRQALFATLDYCERKGLGLIEAVDLVIPEARQCSTDYDKLRWVTRPQEQAAAEAAGQMRYPPCLRGKPHCH